MRHLIVKAALVTAIIGMAPLSAMAQWPERPVTIVVPSGAGGGNRPNGAHAC